jgi:hypothetical protein
VIAALLPGFALATLLTPQWHWWARAAMAPGLSVGFVGVVGTVMHDVHVPFEALTVMPLVVVLAAGAVIRWRGADPAERDFAPWWLPIPALLTGLIGASVFFWALHGQVLPPDWDTATHAGLANTIARTHDVYPLIKIPIEGTDFARPRPGFESTAALLSGLGAPSPAMAMGPIITVTLLLIPVSLSLLALEATGSLALAALVPFFALGLAFPSFQAIVGRYPEIVDSTLIVPFVVAGLRVTRGVFTRDNALLLLAITASIWVIHGLEILTAVVITFGLLAATAVRALRASPSQALIRMGLAVGAVLAGALIVTLLTGTPHVPTPTATQPSSAVLPTPSQVHLRVILASIAQTDLISPVTVVLYAIGAIALIVRRRMLWVLLSQVVLVALMVDDFYLQKLVKFWRAVYPWGEQDRILGYQYWLIPLVLAFGFLTLVSVMRSLSRTRRLQVGATVAGVVVVAVAFLARHALGHVWTSLVGKFLVYTYPLGVFDPLTMLRPWILAMAIAAVAVVIAWIIFVKRPGVAGTFSIRWGPSVIRVDAAAMALGLVAALCLVIGAASELGTYQNAVTARSLVTPADLTVLKTLTAKYPSTTIVMTNGGNDAGMWIAGLTDLTPMVPNGFEYGTLTLPLDVAVSNACTDPADAEEAIAYEASLTNASIVFLGAHVLPSPTYAWSVSCVAKLSNLRLITSVPWKGSMAAAFAIIK